MSLSVSYFKEKLQQMRTLQEKGVQRLPLDLDHEELPVVTCLNCGTEFRGSYCPHCGQKADTRRLSWKTMIDHTFESATNLEKGFLRTCIDLFYRPGYMMRDYIRGRRTDYNKPIQMLFVLSTLHVIVHYLFFQTTGYNVSDSTFVDLQDAGIEEAASLVKQVINYFERNQGATTLLFVMFLVLPNWLMFKFTAFGKKLNIVEHFYVMTFVGCQLMILNILEIPYARLFHGEEHTMVFFSGYSFFIAVWDFKQLFKIHYRKSFRLLVGSSILGFILFLIMVCAASFTYVMLHPEVVQRLKEAAE